MRKDRVPLRLFSSLVEADTFENFEILPVWTEKSEKSWPISDWNNSAHSKTILRKECFFGIRALISLVLKYRKIKGKIISEHHTSGFFLGLNGLNKVKVQKS